jgi:KUP system potassium uptake protein
MTQHSQSKFYGLALAALGVVYGDIGTSPLYAFEQVFDNGFHSAPLNQASILGVLSLFFWALIMIVTIKYVLIVMNANHRGEGGVISLMRLVLNKSEKKPFARALLMLAGILGACFFYGDGVITPAISVLSAVEGLELVSPQLKDYVIPVALLVLFLLFWSQRFGTGKIGALFGPAMFIWFLMLAGLGLLNIFENPDVLKALNPIYAADFVTNNGLLPFFAMGAVVLCLTGAEALYADMGHFGPKPIKFTWVSLVMPCLILNYFGQGALLMKSPDVLESLFYMLAPTWLHTPLVIVATFATVIASQAVISGAFSITKQSIELGFLPKLRVIQTSQHDAGQIYVPAVNLLLATLVIAVILIFKNSSALAGAYGIAVTGTMLITDFLAIAVAITIWRWHRWWALGTGLIFIVVDSVFFLSNSLKFSDGGWFPLALSLILLIVMILHFRKSQVSNQ